MTENQFQKVKRGGSGKIYPKTTRKAIVLEIEAGLSRKDACLKYGMCNTTLSHWLDVFGIPEMRSKRVQVSDQQKRQTVRAILEKRMTIHEAQLFHKQAYSSSIHKWINKFKKENVDLTENNPPSDMQTATTNGQSVLQELSNARLKIAALETMIDIAEQQFKISIRKKPGAKPF